MRIPTVVPDGTARAEDVAATPSGLRASVETLVQQLDARTLADRTQAERGLLDLGPEVLKYLPAPELTPSVAVREALKRIRVQLERRAARESAQASLVRFSGSSTVAELLAVLETQTRNRVELTENAQSISSQTLRVNFDNRPFWECLDEVCDQLKLRYDFDDQRGALRLRPRLPADSHELIVQRSGPFRLAIDSSEIRPILGNSADRLIRISGHVRLEPRLRPLFLHFAAADLAAVANRRQLQPWNKSATYELPVNDAGRKVPVQFDYLLPEGDDPRSVRLSGRLSVQLAAATERIVFDQTAQSPGTARRRGGVTARLRGVTFEPASDGKLNAEIKVSVNYDAGGPAFESHRTWIFHNDVYFETESGTRIDFTDYDTTLQADGAVGVNYRWGQLPGPATQYQFVYEAPTLILDLPMDVSLDSVPVKAIATPPSP
jgi:hypothetical protein